MVTVRIQNLGFSLCPRAPQRTSEKHRERFVSACKSWVSPSNVQCARFPCGLLDPFHSGIHFVPIFSKLPPSSPATRCSKFPRSVPSKASDTGGASVSLFLLEIVGLRSRAGKVDQERQNGPFDRGRCSVHPWPGC